MKKMLAECVIKDGEKLLLASIENALIFSINVSSKEVNIVGCVPEEHFSQTRLFGDFLKWKDKYILIPANAKNLWIVNNTFSKWEKICLSHPDISYKFFKAFVIGDKLYILKTNYYCSLCIDLVTMEKKVLEEEAEDQFFTGMLINNEIYYPSYTSNRLYRIRVGDNKACKYEVKIGNSNAIGYHDDCIILAPRGGKKVLFLSEMNSEIINIPECFAVGVFCYKNKIYIPSCHIGQSLYIDEKKNVYMWNPLGAFVLARELGNDGFALMDYDGNLYLVDYKNENILQYTSKIEENKIKNQMDKYQLYLSKDVVNESVFCDLNYFVGRYLSQEK